MPIRTQRAQVDTDPDIADIAALEPSDGSMLYWATGGTRYNTTPSTSYMRGLLNTASEAALKAAINLEIGVDVQAYSAVLDGTTASFTTADETKLDGIEALADVTDAANVAAAGAVMAANLGTGVQTALGVNVGTAGAPVVNGGALGTPSSGTMTNATGLPVATGISGLGTGQADALAQPTTVFTLEQYGGGTGVTNNTTAWNAMLTAMAAVAHPCLKLRAGRYMFTTQPNAITISLKIVGAGMGATSLCRNYTPAGADDPFLRLQFSYCTLEDFDISPADGTTNGRLLEAILDSSPTVYGNWNHFHRIRTIADSIGGSGTGSCKVEAYLDGDDSPSAPGSPGLRDWTFADCSIGNISGTTNSLYAKTIRHFYFEGLLSNAVSITGGGTYTSTNVILLAKSAGTLSVGKIQSFTCIGHWSSVTIASDAVNGVVISPNATISNSSTTVTTITDALVSTPALTVVGTATINTLNATNNAHTMGSSAGSGIAVNLDCANATGARHVFKNAGTAKWEVGRGPGDGSNNYNWYSYGTGIEGSINQATGGMILGSPTGSYKGTGTLNAVGVYDDNTLLSCYPFDAALDGAVDLAKWDAKVPDRVVPAVFVESDDETIQVSPERVIRRIHDGARKFVARLGTDMDPLTLKGYAKHWKTKRHLPSMPNEANFDPVKGMAAGEWIQRLVEDAEIKAILIDKLEQRLAKLEGLK